MSPKDEFIAALRQKIGFDPVTVSSDDTPNQLRLMGRLPKDPTGLVLKNWLELLRRVMRAEVEAPWSADFSKKYFLRDNEVVYGWRIILQAPDLPPYLPEIARLILEAPQVTAQPQRVVGPVMEIALGGDPNRHSTAGGKRGAGPAGSVAVGPGAAQIKNMGG